MCPRIRLFESRECGTSAGVVEGYRAGGGGGRRRAADDCFLCLHFSEAMPILDCNVLFAVVWVTSSQEHAKRQLDGSSTLVFGDLSDDCARGF